MKGLRAARIEMQRLGMETEAEWSRLKDRQSRKKALLSN